MQTVEPIRDKKKLLEIGNVISNLKKSSRYNKRNKLIWLIGITSGLRVSDILGLNIGDVRNKTSVTIHEKKTGKYKKFPINDKVMPFIEEYLNYYSEFDEDSDPLFTGIKHQRLDRSQVYRDINRACKICGVEGNFGTHTMRKTFGYHHYRQFRDVAILQKIFNHSSPVITLRYIGILQEDIDNSYNKFNILEGQDLTEEEKFYNSDLAVGYNKLSNNNKLLREENKSLHKKLERLAKNHNKYISKVKNEREFYQQDNVIRILKNYIANNGKYKDFAEMILERSEIA